MKRRSFEEGFVPGGDLRRERPLVIDDSTAMAELIRLLGKQSETGMSKTKREENSDS
jgi:hypothetical protein